MKKDCIADFIEAWSKWDRDNKVLYLNWSHRLRDAGYYGISLNNFKSLGEICTWCNKNVGDRHWALCPTSTTFWFETEQDAVHFALRWI